MDLTAIRAKAKDFIGDSGYDDAALDLVINRMYQRVLPLEFSLEALKTEFTVITTEGEDTYAVDPDLYLTIREPLYLNGAGVSLYRNKGTFYGKYPKNPLHAVITADNVNNLFQIMGNYVSLFGAAQTFRVAGSTANDGMYTVLTATYAANMTTINVAAVGDGTGDGTIYQQTNNTPIDVLYWGHNLILRPHPDTNTADQYRLVADSIVVPTILTLITDEPVEALWGMILAIDSAIDIMMNTDRVEEVKALIEIRNKHASLISSKEIMGYSQTRSKPEF